MSLWLLFASLTVIGSLVYNLSLKFGACGTPVLTFVLVMSCTTVLLKALVLLAARYGFKYDAVTGVNGQMLRYAMLAGAAVALIDTAYFLAVRYGSVVASQMFWTVGGSLGLAAFATLFLNEQMTWTKALGIALGIVSVLLIVKKS